MVRVLDQQGLAVSSGSACSSGRDTDSSVLMAMGMMMVPPAVVSLPFKLAFFVMADGWSLLAGALVTGYAT